MPTLVTGDLHLSPNPRDSYRHKIVRKIVRLAERLRVDRTLILGDLTEEKDRHKDFLVNRVVEHVRAFARLGPVIINQGNHDYLTDPDMSFFRFLRHLPQVRWIDRPTAFLADGLGRVMFLPHTRDYKRDWKGMSFKRYAYIFAHGSFTGAELGHGRMVTDGIPRKVFPRDARVISADIHIPQRVGNVTYVGAPYTIDFGDSYDARVLLIDDDRVKSIPIEGPQKRLIEFRGALDEIVGNEGDIVKLRVELARKDVPNWPALRNKLRDAITQQDMIAHSIIPKIVETKGTRVIIKKSIDKSDEQIMRDFAKSRSLDDGTLKHGERLL